PAGVTFDAATKTISGTPTAVGSYTAKATATLDGKSVSKDVIIDVVDIKNGVDGKDGKDGKSPVVTVKDNEDGTHTVKVVNPDGTTT
ncbi:putative Ig domain-containing protein, partial [Streptococcus pneumoniae]|nr:putative Ig domain-containing protein [Streptococcus pneumoniae]